MCGFQHFCTIRPLKEWHVFVFRCFISKATIYHNNESNSFRVCLYQTLVAQSEEIESLF